MLGAISGAVGAVKDKFSSAQSMLGYEKFEKASFYVKNGKAEQKMLDVQFNPSEYTITRGVKTETKEGVGQDVGGKVPQVVSATATQLSLTLYFDSFSSMKQGVGLSSLNSLTGAVNAGNAMLQKLITPSADSSQEDSMQNDIAVNQNMALLLQMIKYNNEEHTPLTVIFVWGNYLSFEGKIESCSVNYSVFSKTGMPVRAKVDMTIIGEELDISINKKSKKPESPDRTKERILPYGDQLWMLADDEYGDPGKWKVIAESNQILNPRSIRQAARIKLPSIR